MNKIEFTEKELLVINDARRKNFWTKVLPLSVGGMLTCSFLMAKGYIGTNRSVLKIMGIGFTGFCAGKFSLVFEVKKRLLQDCPDGKFAQLYTMPPDQRREFLEEDSNVQQGHAGVQQMFNKDTDETVPSSQPLLPFSGDGEKSAVTNQPPANSKPSKSGFSYAEQHAKWSQSETGLPAPPQSSSRPEFSYAQQRALNTAESSLPSRLPAPPQSSSRPEFSFAQQRALNTAESSLLPPGTVQESSANVSTQRVKRNKYGDEME